MRLEWKQILIALVLGVVLGVSGTLRYMSSGSNGSPRWADRGKFHQRMLDKFTSKLQLTPDQRQKVSVILEETRAKMTALRQEVRPKFQGVKNATRAQIREILTPDQQKKFDIMSAEMEERFKKRRDTFSKQGTSKQADWQ